MFGNYFYHKVLYKLVTSFGYLFQNIYIEHQNSSEEAISSFRVPIQYGPKEKFLAKLEQQEELERPVAITLPLISYEMVSIEYDPSRMPANTQYTKVCDSEGKIKKLFLPTPYNVGFQLQIMAKKQLDCLQIVEQILPYFRPSFNLSINLIDDVKEKRDISIVLNSVDFQDDYEGDFSTRRVLIYTLNFTAKTYFFGPVGGDSSDKPINKVIIDFYSSLEKDGTRELRYTLSPDPITAGPGDDYELLEIIEDFTDSRIYSPTQQIDVDP
jgi:hypothetical protein